MHGREEDEERHLLSKRGSSSVLIVPNQAAITFTDLNYSVTVKNSMLSSSYSTKQILFGLRGQFLPGNLSAIMGASGSGKTSLLNCISGFYNEAQGKLAANTVKVNGFYTSPKQMRDIAAFVQQDDVMLDSMTVREMITMSAMLRLPNLSHAEVMNRVDAVIETLDLSEAQHTVIGSSMIKGVSGGERKRTAIGVELVMNNSIVFLDEPTSGLDTFMAFQVVNVLKKLASEGRTIVATIHQPSSQIYHLFNQLMLLGGGRTIYAGPADACVEYFAKLGYNCPVYSNPADFIFMDILNVVTAPKAKINQYGAKNGRAAADGTSTDKAVMVNVTKADSVRTREHVAELAQTWGASPQAAKLNTVIEAQLQTGLQPSTFAKEQSAFLVQLMILSRRAFNHVLRNPIIFKARAGQSVFMSLIIGFVYWNLDTDQTSIQDRSGALFFLITNSIMGNMMPILSVFSSERAVFIREHSSGLYSLRSYFFSKILVEMPFNIVLPVIFATIVYFLCGFQGNYAKFMAATVVCCNCGAVLGIFAGSLFSELTMALNIVPVLFLPLMLFSGFMINTNSIPVYFDWIKWCSPIKYGFEAVMRIEFTDDLVLYCKPDQYINNGTTCPITSGDQVIREYGFSMSLEEDFVYMCVIYAVCLVLSLLALWRVSKSRY